MVHRPDAPVQTEGGGQGKVLQDREAEPMDTRLQAKGVGAPMPVHHLKYLNHINLFI